MDKANTVGNVTTTRPEKRPFHPPASGGGTFKEHDAFLEVKKMEEIVTLPFANEGPSGHRRTSRWKKHKDTVIVLDVHLLNKGQEAWKDGCQPHS